MRIQAMKWTVCGVLALGLALLAVRNSSNAAWQNEKAQRAEAKKAIEDLADGKGDAIEIAKKHELENIMLGFKLRSKGGFGVGAKGQIMPDGIESKIQALTKGKMSPAQLMKEGPALIRMAQITKAIGEVAAHYPDPAKKDLKAWKKYNEDMVKSAKEVQDAIKGNDPTKLKSSVSRLSTSCNECHEKFRD